MAVTDTPSPETIRAFRAENPQMRPRDQADALGLPEAALIAASCGNGVTRIKAHPDAVMGAAQALGEVMALTRNAACVHEKIGEYANYHSGDHAAMILNEAIDLRIFPAHWCHAFMVETETGPRRSLQVFDAAGDAVHKIILRDGSHHGAWEGLRASLALPDQGQVLALAPRKPTEAAKARPDKAEALRAEWRRMTDTHQFLRLTSKLRMNRLGAYRIAGAPFNMHLRRDHIAEVWAVEKQTREGPTTSVEAFDAEGGLIFQVFGLRKETGDHRADFAAMVEGLPDADMAVDA
jgi:putative hemin transport protein